MKKHYPSAGPSITESEIQLVLDAVTNIQIDSFVSGGKVKYVPCRFLEYVHFDR